MSADSSRPRVALHSLVVSLLPDAVREQVDIVEFASPEELAKADVSDVRFFAAGPQAGPVYGQLGRFTRLEVLQTASAGTDWVQSRLPPQATLCSARGARDAPVAEWILGALLGASTHLLERAGAEHWERLELQDLGESTVLIIGMGSIGRRVESYLKPLGTKVLGVASHARDDLHGITELADLLPQADAVVLLTPLSDATAHLIAGPQLAQMKDGAVLINAARGGVLDTDALVAELEHGRLRAVLDVTDPEPLPAGHPLWSAPGLLAITPHIAGSSPAGNRAAAQLAADQLGRWLRHEPLKNVVISPEARDLG
jgi:phosphoglycerate dehydrogenase-like enzyme